MTTPHANDVRELLTSGARADSWPPAQAAAHLLIFTELPGAPQFAAHIEIRDARALGGMVRGAWVRDWNALLADEDLDLTGTERRFLELAASFAAGRPISLSEQATSELGWAGTRRVLEAILIATGSAELLQVTGTAKLTELRACHKFLSAGQSAR